MKGRSKEDGPSPLTAELAPIGDATRFSFSISTALYLFTLWGVLNFLPQPQCS